MTKHEKERVRRITAAQKAIRKTAAAALREAQRKQAEHEAWLRHVADTRAAEEFTRAELERIAKNTPLTTMEAW